MSKIIGIDLGTTNSCVAVLEGGEPLLIQRQVDAVINAVAGEDDVGLHAVQQSPEPLEQARPRERTAGVAGLAQPGERLAGEAEAVDLEALPRVHSVEVVRRE